MERWSLYTPMVHLSVVVVTPPFVAVSSDNKSGQSSAPHDYSNLLPLEGGDLSEVDDALRVAPLVVVPGNDLDLQWQRQRGGCASVGHPVCSPERIAGARSAAGEGTHEVVAHDHGEGRVDGGGHVGHAEVDGHERLVNDGEDALLGAVGGLAEGGVHLREADGKQSAPQSRRCSTHCSRLQQGRFSGAALLRETSLTSSAKVFFSTLQTRSTMETFGVGTRRAMPLSLPLSSGSTSDTALAAPVEVGTMERQAARARRRSRWDASRRRWSPV